MAQDPAAIVALLLGLAFVPPVALLLWVRRDEKRQREPVGAVLRAFLFGATAGVGIALLLNVAFDVGYPRTGAVLGVDQVFLATVIVAPFAEELAKGLGLGTTRRRILELEDGIVYGIALGLGFAATENLVYGIDALRTGGVDLALATLVMRVFSSMLLHACATGLLGFGYSLVIRRGGVAAELLPYYLVAVLLHAVYNFLVLYHAAVGLLVAMAVVFFVLTMLRRRIRQLDALPHQG